MAPQQLGLSANPKPARPLAKTVAPLKSEANTVHPPGETKTSQLHEENAISSDSNPSPPEVPSKPSSPNPRDPLPMREDALRGPNTSSNHDGLRNVVFFGETGVGKSSVINMLREGTAHSGSEILVSSGAVGCTFESKAYRTELNGKQYMLWDTAGLNEGARGTVTHQDSVDNLASLLRNLGGRIHLLVYCIRGKRFRQVIKDNYELFYKQFCGSRVPIVVVVTGLENEEPDMESWWKDNEGDFEKYGLRFQDQACITATRGKVTKDGEYMFEHEYTESREKVRRLIEKWCSEEGYSVFDFRYQNRVGTSEQSSRHRHDGLDLGATSVHTGHLPALIALLRDLFDRLGEFFEPRR